MRAVSRLLEKRDSNLREIAQIAEKVKPEDVVQGVWKEDRLKQAKLENEVTIINWVLGDNTIYG